jgi:hypothetical protein
MAWPIFEEYSGKSKGFKKVAQATSVSNPVYTDTGIPVFGTPNTDTGQKLPVFAGITGILLTTKRSFFCHKM